MRRTPDPIWGRPCPPSDRIGIDRYNPTFAEIGKGASLWIASPYLLSHDAHWLEGRTSVCQGEQCDVDHDWQAPIWMAYLHVVYPSLQRGGWAHGWIRVTPSAARRVPILGDPAIPLRGLEIQVRRVDNRPNARVEILPTGRRREDLPDPIDLRPFVVQLLSADNLPAGRRLERRRDRNDNA